MGRHAVTKSKVTSNAFEHRVNGLLADGFILIHSVIGLATEHIVTEANVWSVLKVQGDSFNNCSVDGDVAITLMLARVPSFLFQNGEPVTECAIIIDDVGEAQESEGH